MSQKPIFQKPIFWIAVVAIAVVGYTTTNPDTASKAAKRPPKKSAPVKKGLDTFTEEDKLASFPRIDVEFKNSFVPLVAKTDGLGGGDGAANTIPTSFTGGGQWVFTGTFEVDGVREALLENRSTAEGVFLRRGQRWKNCVVKKVNEDSIVIEGPSGEMTFGLVTEEKLMSSRIAANSRNSFAPAGVDNPPSFRGDIGGGRNNGRLPGVNGGGFSAVPSGNGGPPAIITTDDVPFPVPLGGQ